MVGGALAYYTERLGFDCHLGDEISAGDGKPVYVPYARERIYKRHTRWQMRFCLERTQLSKSVTRKSVCRGVLVQQQPVERN